MDSSNLQCQICYLDYDSKDHCPRVIPACGHTLCSLCIQGIMNQKRQMIFQCPFDKITYQVANKTCTIFPKNFALLQIIEAKPEEEETLTTCPLHHKMLRFVCINCRQKICADCSKIKNHEDHEIHVIADIKKAIEVRAQDIENLVGQIENEYKYPTRKLDSALYDREKQLLKKVELRFDVYFKILQQTKKNIETEIQKLSNDSRYEILEKYNDVAPTDQENTLTSDLMQWRGRAKQALYNWKAESSMGKKNSQELSLTDYQLLDIEMNETKETKKDFRNLRKENEKFKEIMNHISSLDVLFDSDNVMLQTFPKYRLSNFDKIQGVFPTPQEDDDEEEKKGGDDNNEGGLIKAKNVGKGDGSANSLNEVDKSNVKPLFYEKLEEERKLIEHEFRDNEFDASWNGPQIQISFNQKPKLNRFFSSVIKFANTKTLPQAYQHVYSLQIHIDQITDKVFEKFLKPFQRLLNLKHLTIKFINESPITYASIELFAKVISKLFQLESLFLDTSLCPEIGSDGVTAIMYSICQLPCLSDLNFKIPVLNGNRKDLYGLSDGIVNSLQKMKALTSLTLDIPPNDYMNDNDIIKLSAGCFEVQRLSSLDLNFSNLSKFTAKGTTTMLQYISNMVKLKKVKLAFDIKNPDNVNDLALCIPNFFNLDYLGLIFSEAKNINQGNMVALGEAFSELIHLKGLELEFNNYTGAVAQFLGEYINRLKNLKTLKFKFRHCATQFDNLGKLIQPLMILNNVETFQIVYPKFSINEIAIISQFLNNQKKVKNIHIEIDGLLQNINDEKFVKIIDVVLKAPQVIQSFVLNVHNASTLADGCLIRLVDNLPLMTQLTEFNLTYNGSYASDIMLKQIIQKLLGQASIKKVELVFEDSHLHNNEDYAKLWDLFESEKAKYFGRELNLYINDAP